MNKIIRAGYGKDTTYQDLALESFSGWDEWNEEMKSWRAER
jgi:hypothetical protein